MCRCRLHRVRRENWYCQFICVQSIFSIRERKHTTKCWMISSVFTSMRVLLEQTIVHFNSTFFERIELKFFLFADDCEAGHFDCGIIEILWFSISWKVKWNPITIELNPNYSRHTRHRSLHFRLLLLFRNDFSSLKFYFVELPNDFICQISIEVRFVSLSFLNFIHKT